MANQFFNSNGKRAKGRKRQEDTRLKTKPVDLANKKPVYIPALKMTVWVDKHIPDVDVIAKYERQRASSLKGDRWG